jgi:hypothetical protein
MSPAGQTAAPGAQGPPPAALIVDVPAHGIPANAALDASMISPAQATNTFLYITTPPATYNAKPVNNRLKQGMLRYSLLASLA